MSPDWSRVAAQIVGGLQPVPYDSKENDTVAMLVPHTIEVNEILW